MAHRDFRFDRLGRLEDLTTGEYMNVERFEPSEEDMEWYSQYEYGRKTGQIIPFSVARFGLFNGTCFEFYQVVS